MSDEPNPLKEAMLALQDALHKLKPEEMVVVRDIQKEVDAAKKAGTVDNPQLEFCYTIKFSQDRISNAKLLGACEAYIKAVEG